MMFDHMGWGEVAEAITNAMTRTYRAKTVTYDFARLMEGATKVKCSEFAREVARHMHQPVHA
jgi:isocitrate dehydrogenase